MAATVVVHSQGLLLPMRSLDRRVWQMPPRHGYSEALFPLATTFIASRQQAYSELHRFVPEC